MLAARWFAFLCSCFTAASVSTDVAAQAWPAKPVRIVIGYGVGGAVDFTARLVAQKLPEVLKQSFVVENRPGAGSTIGMERVATSPPDGYTLLVMPTTGVVQSALRPNLPYNLERDLQPISLIASGPFVLVVHPSVPARDVRAFIKLAGSMPGKLSHASPGVGTANHLAGELFNAMANVSLVHVPYKSGGEAAVAAAGGQVDSSFVSIAGALPLLESRRVRPLAVTASKRTTLMPEVPTLDEAGVPGYEYTVWYGLLGPAGLPRDVLARLNAAIGQVVAMTDVQDSFRRQGIEARATTPDEFAQIIRTGLAVNGKLVKQTGLKPE